MSGGQGTGKTTTTGILKIILKKFFKRNVYVTSIDHFYKTFKERNKLSKKIHPLLKTRGVPGTHDIHIGLKTLDSLFTAKPSTLTPIPAFSKPLDERKPKSTWEVFEGKPDYIFFDAWFGGAKPLSEKNWKTPINTLELKEDTDGVWSKLSNRELAGDYQVLFDRFDLLIIIKVTHMVIVH